MANRYVMCNLAQDIKPPRGCCATGSELVDTMNPRVIQIGDFQLIENTSRHSVSDIKRHQSRSIMLHPATQLQVGKKKHPQTQGQYGHQGRRIQADAITNVASIISYPFLVS